MEADKLKKWIDYQITGEYLPHEKYYVMNQFLSSTKKEWATFFSIVGSKKNYRIFRTKIPLESIIKIEKKVVTALEKPVTTPIPPYAEKNNSMQEWLKEVKQMIEKTKYRESESFEEYFGRE